MSNSRTLRGCQGVVGALALIVALPASAAAVVGGQGTAPAAAPGAGLAAGQKTSQPGYLLRCWQYGRLIIEEPYLLPPDGADLKSARIRLADRTSRPIFVAETANATCLVRPGSADRERVGGDPLQR